MQFFTIVLWPLLDIVNQSPGFLFIYLSCSDLSYLLAGRAVTRFSPRAALSCSGDRVNPQLEGQRSLTTLCLQTAPDK